jgi:hypothetical protein
MRSLLRIDTIEECRGAAKYNRRVHCNRGAPRGELRQLSKFDSN